MNYLRDPKAIYEASFRQIEGELAALGRAPDALTTRLVHACGMVDIVDDLQVSEGAVSAGNAALENSAPIYCDTEMVARGIIARGLKSETIVTLNRPDVPDLAKSLGTTRSAAAVEHWRDGLKGAIVAIGNAPTALFHLLERFQSGWPKPALIIGIPVGFVGAAESKAALAELSPAPFITIHGRRGGSALAAAAVNALSLGLGGDGT